MGLNAFPYRFRRQKSAGGKPPALFTRRCLQSGPGGPVEPVSPEKWAGQSIIIAVCAFKSVIFSRRRRDRPAGPRTHYRAAEQLLKGGLLFAPL